MKKFFLLFLVVWFTNNSYSQKDANVYDFFGGKSFANKTVFYRLLFQIKNGKVAGYAYTDEQGTQETKSLISGIFNVKTKTIIFSETEKVLTKSRQKYDDFCYLSGVVSIDINRDISKISGTFVEVSKSGKKCNQGKIEIISPDSFSRLKKTIVLEKEVSLVKKPKLTDLKKQELPTFKSNDKITIKDDEEITIFWNSDKLILDIWDDAKEDDDQITIQFNDKIILKEHTLKNKKETLEFNLFSGENKLIFTADNTGFIANNTARVDLFDDKIKHQIVTKLKLNKSVTVYLVRK